MNLKTLEGFDVSGKKVLVRVDFNVPMEGDRVTDDTRIKAHLETLMMLRKERLALPWLPTLADPRAELCPTLPETGM